jgi:selenide,water dikinase
LDSLPTFDRDERLLVGTETEDDACVFRVTHDTAIVQTVDMFPPVVNDPLWYGRIVAANSLSDCYAMGAKPLSVMNIISFPDSKIDMPVLSMILRGAVETIKKSGAVLMGGHTQGQDEINFGLSVTGVVHPDKIIRNSTARPGDVLFLTKPLGIGIITTAIRGDLVPPELQEKISKSMATLNADAADAMVEAGVNAATDVTGFGLMGHALEMALGSGVTIEISAGRVPYFEEAIEFFEMGITPAGTLTNMKYIMRFTDADSSVEESVATILCDAQTSGGLLISVAKDRADALGNALKKRGVFHAEIGRVVKRNKKNLVVSI